MSLAVKGQKNTIWCHCQGVGKGTFSPFWKKGVSFSSQWKGGCGWVSRVCNKHFCMWIILSFCIHFINIVVVSVHFLIAVSRKLFSSQAVICTLLCLQFKTPSPAEGGEVKGISEYYLVWKSLVGEKGRGHYIWDCHT